MPGPMTLEQTILALKGLPDQRQNPVRMFHGRLVFPAVGYLADALRAAGIAARTDVDDTSLDLWIDFKP